MPNEPPVRRDRRGGTERREDERRLVIEPVPVERRAAGDRRQDPERRRGSDRRGAGVSDQIRSALALIIQVAERGELGDEHRRDLDTAVFRLRFALDRLETEDG